MEITLARHGKPDLRLDSWVMPMAMRDWLQHYDQADIALNAAPATTQAKATAARLVASSPLRRCMQSAQQLAQGRAILSEELFCEAELPQPYWPYPKLPPLVWGMLSRLVWFYGLTANGEPPGHTTLRAHQAAERLIQLAKENDSVFLVGHGIMTMLIARELLALGWSGPKRPISGYWQCSVYHAPG